MKMLEIGLGCDMNYEPGASVALWKKLFPQAELWEAEYDAKCVEQAKTLDEWLEKSGGGFDVIIDGEPRNA